MRRPPRPLQDRVIDRRMWEEALAIGFAMALATLATLDLYLPGGLIDGHQIVDNARARVGRVTADPTWRTICASCARLRRSA